MKKEKKFIYESALELAGKINAELGGSPRLDVINTHLTSIIKNLNEELIGEIITQPEPKKPLV